MIQVWIKTSLGDLLAEIDDARAPRTAAHFIAYAEAGYYDGASIYRTVRPDNQPGSTAPISIVEAGYYNAYYEGLLRGGDVGAFDEAQMPRGPRPRILLESTADTGILHRDGTLSYGRGQALDSVDDSWFICLGDQPELDYGGSRYADCCGFAAFGRIVAGMDIIRAIWQLPAEGQKLLQDIPILSIRRR